MTLVHEKLSEFGEENHKNEQDTAQYHTKKEGTKEKGEWMDAWILWGNRYFPRMSQKVKQIMLILISTKVSGLTKVEILLVLLVAFLHGYLYYYFSSQGVGINLEFVVIPTIETTLSWESCLIL